MCSPCSFLTEIKNLIFQCTAYLCILLNDAEKNFIYFDTIDKIRTLNNYAINFLTRSSSNLPFNFCA